MADPTDPADPTGTPPIPAQLGHSSKRRPLASYPPGTINNDPATGRFMTGNKAGRRRRLNLYGGVVDPKASPTYKKFYRLARAFAKHRRSEYVTQFGLVSAGVAAILEVAAVALAHSKFYNNMGTRESDPLRQEELFSKSAKFAEMFTKHETAAYNLAAAEGKHRPKDDPRELLAQLMGPKALKE